MNQLQVLVVNTFTNDTDFAQNCKWSKSCVTGLRILFRSKKNCQYTVGIDKILVKIKSESSRINMKRNLQGFKVAFEIKW